ncbi:MAG: TlpA family protein disulfide reductase [Gammaproteobacteria bacterium]|nr:TlpA family protein disulfide reductase [Gammaproteobacteria bacterium]
MHHVLRAIATLLFVVGLLGSAWAESNVLHPVEGQPQAADFTLNDIDDNIHRLSDYRGKVVIVNFWATWCPPCRFELPSMEKLWQAVQKKDVVMLAINIGEDADTIFTFTTDYPVTFPLLMDHDSSVIKRYPVLGVPTSFVLDPKGRIIYRAVGTREWDDKVIIQQILSLKK